MIEKANQARNDRLVIQGANEISSTGGNMAKLLIVDDDRDLLDMLRYIFQREGHKVITAIDGDIALHVFETEAPDLVILDLLMPRMGGLLVLQQIRRVSTLPVIILTSLGDEEHTVSALDAGADDYLAKPFRPRELKSRVRALLRRTSEELTGKEQHSKPLLMGDIYLNARTQQVSVRGSSVKLTPTEFSLLEYLMVNCNRVVSRPDIIANVWGFDADENEDVVRVNISRLRRKIEKDSSDPQYILTVPGVGYRFVYNSPQAPSSAPSES